MQAWDAFGRPPLTTTVPTLVLARQLDA